MRDPAIKQPLQDRLAVNNRLRVMGAIEEGEVDVGPLLGRGAFGRVYKGAPQPFVVAYIQLHQLSHAQVLSCMHTLDMVGTE